MELNSVRCWTEGLCLVLFKSIQDKNARAGFCLSGHVSHSWCLAQSRNHCLAVTPRGRGKAWLKSLAVLAVFWVCVSRFYFSLSCSHLIGNRWTIKLPKRVDNCPWQYLASDLCPYLHTTFELFVVSSLACPAEQGSDRMILGVQPGLTQHRQGFWLFSLNRIIPYTPYALFWAWDAPEVHSSQSLLHNCNLITW